MQRIERLLPKLSKGQKLIAKYIQTEYGKAAFMTAAKLGETVGVSESTVVRFATELGYSGYPKMQQAMQEMIRDKLTSFQRIEAKTIYIYGLRSSSTLAGFMGYYLNLIFGNVKVISTADRARLYEEFNRIGNEDVMIGITFMMLSFEPNFNFEANITASVSCCNNVGPGLGLVGPMAGYGGYSNFSKLILTFAMLLGRLEIYPVLLAFYPKTWAKK